MFRRVFANKLIINILKEKIKSVCSKDKSYVYIIWSDSKIMVESQWCFPTATYSFEGMQLQSFHVAEEYLKRHYGVDYRELPPEEKRRVGINMVKILD